MDIDKNAIKALSSETRINILKSLGERRKMPNELAKEMGMSAPTIISHLKQLESSGLVKKKETGHKWIYYELSKTGSNIVAPKMPIHLILGVVVGVIFVAGGGFLYAVSIGVEPSQFNYIDSLKKPALTESAAESEMKDISKLSEPAKQFPYKEAFLLILIATGAVLLVYSLGRFWYIRK